MTHLLIILAIGLLILTHELGHLVAAKLSGIPVARFSVGFGHRLWGFTRGGTEYRLAVIPFGGYVLPKVSSHEEMRQFPVSRRLLFFLGGPAANVVAAYLFLAGVHMAADGAAVHTALAAAGRDMVSITAQILAMIPGLFDKPELLSGPLGIVAIGAQYTGLSLVKVSLLAASLSIQLAILNLLPVPPLDGGKIVIALLEKLYSPLARLELPLALTGWILLLALMVYATVQDFGKLLGGTIT